jgi:dTDP-L-rhamnose 4-epimerase
LKILITGGAGFIGSHLADRYLHEGWSVRVLDCLQPRVHPHGMPPYLAKEIEFLKADVTQRQAWERALDGVDYVSHQAAYQDYATDYGSFSLVNVFGTALLFEVIAAKRLPVQRVVFASSQAAYGEGQFTCPEHGLILPPPRPLEQLERRQWEVVCPHCARVLAPALLEESYANPLSPYGTSKYSQEMTALKLAAQLQIPCVALRYSITQGPRQSLFNQYSGIARIFAAKLLRGEAPIAFEDGLSQRDYIHVQDVVEANWLVTNGDRRAIGQVYNVGSGQPTSVLAYARGLARKLGKSIDPQVPGIFRVGDARHSVSSIAKLRQLGWQPKRSLDDIMEDFLCWVTESCDLKGLPSRGYEDLLRMNVLRTATAPPRRAQPGMAQV